MIYVLWNNRQRNDRSVLQAKGMGYFQDPTGGGEYQ